MEDFPLPFVPASIYRRYAGWTVDRQQEFIRCLAETGSVSLAAKAVEMTRQSAYRLRMRPGSEQFARAWDLALGQAGHHLLAVAIDRALNGSVTQIRKDGYVVAERTAPSDRLLTWAVDRLLPRNGPAPAPIEDLGEAIARIADDDPAETEHSYDLAFAEEAGRRGEAIQQARQLALERHHSAREFLASADRALDSASTV